MTADGVLALGAFLLVSYLLIRFACARADDPSDRFQDARDFIGRQIEDHIVALAAVYCEERSEAARRPGSEHFAQAIERFIGDVLLRRAERTERWLKQALREILVLERDWIYSEVTERVEAHLRTSSGIE